VESLRTKARFKIAAPRDLSEKRNQVCKTSYAGERIIFADYCENYLTMNKIILRIIVRRKEAK